LCVFFYLSVANPTLLTLTYRSLKVFGFPASRICLNILQRLVISEHFRLFELSHAFVSHSLSLKTINHQGLSDLTQPLESSFLKSSVVLVTRYHQRYNSHPTSEMNLLTLLHSFPWSVFNCHLCSSGSLLFFLVPFR